MHISEAHLNPFSLSANFQQRTLKQCYRRSSPRAAHKNAPHFSLSPAGRGRGEGSRKDVERRFIDLGRSGREEGNEIRLV
jgi:serine/threonine protein kinase HipA of HipAB toxin-antitoxin module